MKSSRPFRSKPRGSILLTVTLVIAVMAILSASILKYSLTERRGNERNRLTIRAQNTAENISLYAAEQLTTKLYRLGTAPVGQFPSSGTSTSVIRLPVANLASTSNVLLSEFNTTASGMEVRAAIESASAYELVTDTTSTNYGLQVGTAKIPIISKGTATLPEIGTITAYVEQDMELSLTPLFQFGLFYNMDLELYPSAAFTVSGPVHTNKSLMAHPDHGSTQTILFTDRVTAAEYIVADQALKAATRYGDGSMPAATPNNGNVVLTHTDGVLTTPMRSGTQWRDCRWFLGTYPPASTEVGNFNTWAALATVCNANVKAKSNTLELPGVGSYKQVDDPATAEDERNNGRQIIESPDHKRWDGTAFTATTDTADLKQIKISWRAGLYIMVNPDDTQFRTGKLPNGTTVTLLPRSYRCWLNKINSDGTHTIREVVLPGQPSYGYNDNSTTGTTADDFMYKNNLPNQFTNTTSVGPNQVLRIPSGGNTWDALVTPLSSAVVDTAATASPIQTTGYGLSGGSGAAFPADSAAQPYAADAYFFDLRRANGSGAMSTTSGATAFGRGSGSAAFTPRPIAKIDFDMGRFKMMVNRVVSAATTSTGYKLDLPLAADPTSGTSSMWGYSIYNSGASPTSFGLGVLSGGSYSDATNCFPIAGSTANMQRRDPFQLYYAPTATSTPAAPALPTDYRSMAVPVADLTAAWYDGVAIYVHSLDAEQRSQTSGVADRLDSGVRLWNGRGPLPSLTTVSKTGCTFATNDAVYIVGHYNADGHIDSSTTDLGTGLPDFFGGYSAKYSDSSDEYLSAVFGDAIMILSQPTFARNGSSGAYTFDQTSGWADAKSALPASGSSASDWETAAGGSADGVSSPTAIKPGALPNLSTPSTSSGATASGNKLFALDTEISTALVVGIVPSHHNPTGLTDRAPTSGTSGGGVYVTVSGVAGNNVNSGGANNFPRLLEDWSGDLYIRGSMVALFESRVAMEPFTHSRCYGAPGRFWGLHYKFSQEGHDVPLEPIVLSATRVGFRRLTPAQYADRKTFIEAMTYTIP